MENSEDTKKPPDPAVARRVGYAMEKSGVSRGDIQEATKRGYEQVGRWLRASHRIPLENLRVIADLTGFSFTWLDTGEGPQRPGEAPSDEIVIDLDLSPGESRKRVVPVFGESGEVDYYIKAVYRRLTKAEGEEEIEDM